LGSGSLISLAALGGVRRPGESGTKPCCLRNLQGRGLAEKKRGSKTGESERGGGQTQCRMKNRKRSNPISPGESPGPRRPNSLKGRDFKKKKKKKKKNPAQQANKRKKTLIKVVSNCPCCEAGTLKVPDPQRKENSGGREGVSRPSYVEVSRIFQHLQGAEYTGRRETVRQWGEEKTTQARVIV